MAVSKEKKLKKKKQTKETNEWDETRSFETIGQDVYDDEKTAIHARIFSVINDYFHLFCPSAYTPTHLLTHVVNSFISYITNIYINDINY